MRLGNPVSGSWTDRWWERLENSSRSALTLGIHQIGGGHIGQCLGRIGIAEY